jgi:hypothetical protein
MRCASFSTFVLLSLLVSGCASPPPAPVTQRLDPSDPQYWSKWWNQSDALAVRADRYAIYAGHPPGETYRSLKSMSCMQRFKIADATVRAQADAECAALAAMPATPTPVTTDCQPNYNGGFSCTTHH